MKDKVVIITGASSGIGKACALVFARAGAKVVICSRRHDQLSHWAVELLKHTEVLTVTADVSKEADCKRLIEGAVKRFGRIDVLINNAGVSMRALFNEVDLDVIRQLMDTNFWGTIYCTKYALPSLLVNKGSVVGISSIAGKKGLPGRTGYSASKFAMEGFLQALRTENLKKDLHVLVVSPGFTASDIRKVSLTKDGSVQGESPRDEKSMMQPEEVAQKIYDAVVHRRRDLILGAQGRLTVFLNKFFPAFMDGQEYNHLAKEPDSPFKS
jgi:dehydrogenase/reductase SDR family protein 7B